MCCHGYKDSLVFYRLKEDEKKIANMVITFSPLEVRYLATCHHTISPSTDLSELEKFAFEMIYQHAKEGKSLSIKVLTLFTFFPLLGRQVKDYDVGTRKDRSILLYFESLEPWSHNRALKRIFGNILNSMPYTEKYEELKKHVDTCSVRLGEFDKKGSVMVYSPLYGLKEEEVDLETFLNDTSPSFFTVHGNKAVRELNEKRDKKIINELKTLPEVWRK